MAAKKKAKKLTQREKQLRAEIKKELQEKGIRPPDKPKLNRKKFVAEAEKEWEARDESFIWDYYIFQAISYMIGKIEGRSLRVSPEAVGVAKVLKIAIRLREFSQKLKETGEHEYKVVDQYNYIKDILDA